MIRSGKITRPEEANRAITPFKDDVRTIITETAAFADAKVARARRSGQRLAQSVLFNVIATCLLVIVPSGVIIIWTIWLTREIIARNNKLAEAKCAAESADRAKSEFLANISHELRTPLHGILSYAKFGLSEAATAQREELHEFFHNVDHCADNLLHLVNDLLDLSKLEAGRMSLDFRLADLHELVALVIDEFRSLYSEHEVEIRYQGPAAPIAANVDPDRIQQVVRNLLSNAVKFSPAWGIIDVRLQAAGRAALLSVCDQGPGIPPEELEAIFDKFVQSSKTKSNQGGTGLGLAICREIVGGHQGRVWAENNAATGCTLYCRLPLATPDPLPGKSAAEPPRKLKNSLGQVT